MSTSSNRTPMPGWRIVAMSAASVPLAVMLTFALTAITAAINERACVWTMRGGLTVSALLPLIATCVVVARMIARRCARRGFS